MEEDLLEITRCMGGDDGGVSFVALRNLVQDIERGNLNKERYERKIRELRFSLRCIANSVRAIKGMKQRELITDEVQHGKSL